MPEHTLRILHMSDLHERVELPWMKDERKAKIRGMKAGRYRVLGGSLTPVLQEIAADGKVDLLCFTGDVADRGLPEEYEQATERLQTIAGAAWTARVALRPPRGAKANVASAAAYSNPYRLSWTCCVQSSRNPGNAGSVWGRMVTS